MNTLYFTPTSPFVRKIRVLIRELGLQDQFDEVLSAPLDDPAALLAANPLAKVPAMKLANGDMLYDSRVICDWLLAHRPTSAAAPGDNAHWQTRRRAALADGMTDAAVAMSFENRRPAEQQSDYWLARWTRAIERAVAALNGEVATLAADIDAVSAAAALSYLDLRQPQIAWRTQAPALSDWLDTFAQRPSMQATAPA